MAPIEAKAIQWLFASPNPVWEGPLTHLRVERKPPLALVYLPNIWKFSVEIFIKVAIEFTFFCRSAG